MKAKLILTPTHGMSREEWLAYRHTGIGASEVGTIMGLDDYTSSLELFYYKAGNIPKFDTESMAAFVGREQEDFVAEMWRYWAGSEQSMIANWRMDNRVRQCQRVQAFVKNPDVPWLYVSLDRKINKTATAGEGALEIKTIARWEAQKWEGGIPPKYVTQITTQTGVCEFQFGEMALFQDGRNLSVLPLAHNSRIWDKIVTVTGDFWERVVKARKLVNEKYHPDNLFNQKRMQQIEAEIDNLAPEPDGSDSYSRYLTEKFKAGKPLSRPGTPQELTWARSHTDLSDHIKQLERQQREAENKLKASMGESVQQLSFQGHGNIYWSKQSDGKRVFRNKVQVNVPF